jgi:hypothetical protein
MLRPTQEHVGKGAHMEVIELLSNTFVKGESVSEFFKQFVWP